MSNEKKVLTMLDGYRVRTMSNENKDLQYRMCQSIGYSRSRGSKKKVNLQHSAVSFQERRCERQMPLQVAMDHYNTLCMKNPGRKTVSSTAVHVQRKTSKVNLKILKRMTTCWASVRIYLWSTIQNWRNKRQRNKNKRKRNLKNKKLCKLNMHTISSFIDIRAVRKLLY